MSESASSGESSARRHVPVGPLVTRRLALLPTATEENIPRGEESAPERVREASSELRRRLHDSMTEQLLREEWRLLDSHPVSTFTELSIVGFERAVDEPSTYWRVVEDGSRWHRYVAERFEQLCEQTDRSDKPTLETLNLAWSIVDRLLPPSTSTPSVLPSEGGGVELFWQKGGWDVQVEIDSHGAGNVWTRDRNSGDNHYGSLRERRDELLDVLGMLSTD